MPLSEITDVSMRVSYPALSSQDLIISPPPPYGASCVAASFANSGIAQRTTTTLLNYSQQKMPQKEKEKKKMENKSAAKETASLTHSYWRMQRAGEEEKLGSESQHLWRVKKGTGGTRVVPGAYIQGGASARIVSWDDFDLWFSTVLPSCLASLAQAEPGRGWVSQNQSTQPSYPSRCPSLYSRVTT